MLRKKTSIRQQIKDLKFKIAGLGDKAATLEISENLSEKDKSELDAMFNLYTRVHGPVPYESWLMAVYKHMRKKLVTPVYLEIVSLPMSILKSEQIKLRYLKHLSLRWGLDVTIIDNKAKPLSTKPQQLAVLTD